MVDDKNFEFLKKTIESEHKVTKEPIHEIAIKRTWAWVHNSLAQDVKKFIILSRDKKVN